MEGPFRVAEPRRFLRLAGQQVKQAAVDDGNDDARLVLFFERLFFNIVAFRFFLTVFVKFIEQRQIVSPAPARFLRPCVVVRTDAALDILFKATDAASRFNERRNRETIIGNFRRQPPLTQPFVKRLDDRSADEMDAKRNDLIFFRSHSYEITTFMPSHG